MNYQTLLDILNNICDSLHNDGTINEEIIEMLIDNGAKIDTIKALGFTEEDIENYIYYAQQVSLRSREEVEAEFM